MTSASLSSASDCVNPPLSLDQRGRAGVDALGAIQKAASTVLRAHAEQAFGRSPAGKALESGPDKGDWRAWIDESAAVAAADPVFRLERFFQAYVAAMIYEVGIPAVEHRREAIERHAQGSGPGAEGSLELDPDLSIPAYYDVDWHLRPGGWEGYDLYGALGALVIQPIFRHGGVAAAPAGENIRQHRLQVVGCLPKPRYHRIYEPGCGPAVTLMAAHQLYPEAELIGSDLSALMLIEAHRAAERSGVRMALKQRDAATDTREPDASVDAVVTFALHHELPTPTNITLLREMFRILKPGGDIVLADPPPFRATPPFQAVMLDWERDNRAEPYFSDACMADWGQVLSDIGFVGVYAKPLGERMYPWVTVGAKPPPN